MSFHSCVSGCGRFLAPSNGHDHCISCLHSHCGNMTIAMMPSRLLFIKRGGVPLPIPCSSSSVSKQQRTTSAYGQGDLRVTVRASSSSASPRAPHSSSTSHPLVIRDEVAEIERRCLMQIIHANYNWLVLLTLEGDWSLW